MEALFQCLDELEDLALICWERARALCPATEPRSGGTTKPIRPRLGSRAIDMATASCPAEAAGRSGT
jgi:hypothetical protein